METDHLLSINCKTSESLQFTLKHRDEYTQLHCERIANLAVQAGLQCGLDDESLYQLETAAIFHDIGKIGIPDNILLNPGKLTQNEYLLMQSHATIGASITEKLDIPNAEKIGQIIRHHHEHFDGSGYPDNLTGDKIPLSSRIITIIDVFDALSTPRCYRDPISHEQTLNLMSTTMKNHFDPDIFKIISQVIVETTL